MDLILLHDLYITLIYGYKAILKTTYLAALTVKLLQHFECRLLNSHIGNLFMSPGNNSYLIGPVLGEIGKLCLTYFGCQLINHAQSLAFLVLIIFLLLIWLHNSSVPPHTGGSIL